ncbi:MAG TPA: response regulator [Ktedonobacterales bacterium]
MAAGLVVSSSALGVPSARVGLAPGKTSIAPAPYTLANDPANDLANDAHGSDRAEPQPPDDESAPERGSAVERPAAKWSLLVVEDEHDVRMMLRSLLELEGFTVGEASDGLGGLALLRASRSPLIVLLDYKMPRMNGEELLRAVSADPALAGRDAFIFVTANLLAFSPELLQVVQDAAIPVIQKPYALSTVLEEIDRAGARLEEKGTGPSA